MVGLGIRTLFHIETVITAFVALELTVIKAKEQRYGARYYEGNRDVC